MTKRLAGDILCVKIKRGGVRAKITHGGKRRDGMAGDGFSPHPTGTFYGESIINALRGFDGRKYLSERIVVLPSV